MLSRALTILALATAARALCADPAVVRSKILAAVVAESSEECTAICSVAGSSYAYYSPGSCLCGNDANLGDGVVSAPDCGMAYSVQYTFAPAGKGGPSGALQRRAAEACPTSKLKCNKASGIGYECVDARTNSQSCGGCVYGRYGAPESASGEDCRYLPGVAEGGATCVASRCKVTQCADGWSTRTNPKDIDDIGCVYHVYQSGIFRSPASEEANRASVLKGPKVAAKYEDPGEEEDEVAKSEAAAEIAVSYANLTADATAPGFLTSADEGDVVVPELSKASKGSKV